MTEVVAEVQQRTKSSVGVKAPLKKAASAAHSRRRSNRLMAKKKSLEGAKGHPGRGNAEPAPRGDLAKGFMDRLDAISRKLSQLALHRDEHSVEEAAESVVKREKSIEAAEPALSEESDETLQVPRYPIVASKEKEVCTDLYAPLEEVPERGALRTTLQETLAVKIPIHHSTYMWLQDHVEKQVVDSVFSIVEEVGNICPRLTPRVETALQVRASSDGTESMQQSVLDTFLMGIVGTAQEYLEMDVKVDRNANELSMTKTMCRPDYLLILNGQLVFKGEEKRHGTVRHIAEELIDKMIPGSVGPNGKLEYLLGYATAGSRILFECIYADGKMSECSDIINIERVADRVTLLIILVNMIRIARTLYNDKHQ
ncbi:hypothetical protein GGF46_000086 [Coemansia sp. RSA 552]|nr:hypothetical protein GGF46_000086 [Coemansia sp. RSA 552]